MPVGVRPPWVKTSNPRSAAPTHVDGHDHALGPELVGDLGDELGPVDRGRVLIADLVGPGPQQPPGVVDGAHAAADGEGDEHLLGGPGHDVDHRLAAVRATR